MVTGKRRWIRRVKPQGDAQAGAVIGQLDAHLMERRDCFDQAEAKSASWRAAAALQPIKTPEYSSALLGWDPRPPVTHHDHHRAWQPGGYQTNGLAHRRMLHRILNYVRNHLGQELAVTPDYEL